MSDEPTPRIVRWPTDDEVWAEFDAYTRAVGRVSHAWNFFHEKLGALFAHLINAPHREMTAAVWYSTFSDRAQRQMLEAAIESWPLHFWDSLPKSAKEDLIWLLRRADQLGNKRDDAIHAPASLYTDPEKTQMATSVFSGHRRAKNLRGKGLLVEFDWLERYIEELSRFTQQATNAIAYPNFAWPGRPDTPNRRPRRALLDREHRQRDSK